MKMNWNVAGIAIRHLQNIAKLHRDRVYGRSTYCGKRLIANEAQTKGNYVLLVGYARIKPFEAPLPFFSCCCCLSFFDENKSFVYSSNIKCYFHWDVRLQ